MSTAVLDPRGVPRTLDDVKASMRARGRRSRAGRDPSTGLRGHATPGVDAGDCERSCCSRWRGRCCRRGTSPRVAAPAGHRRGRCRPAERVRASRRTSVVILRRPPRHPALRSFAADGTSVVHGGCGRLYAAGVIVMLLLFALRRWTHPPARARGHGRAGPEWTRLLSECADRMGIRRAGPAASQPRVQHADGVRHAAVRRSSFRPSPTRGPKTGGAPWSSTSWRTSRRYDCLTQTLAFAACAMYWFHPGVWWVARRLRIERELACDDRVIAAGSGCREYAGPPARDRVYVRQPSRAGAGRQHGATRVSSKGGCSRRSMPRETAPCPPRVGASPRRR